MIFCIKKGAVISLLLLAIILSTSSCEKFEGEQTVPSYISIDTFYLRDNPNIQEGKLTHDFTDAWVYVDDQLIGAFELPAIVPVLQNGYHKLALYPGIKYNTLSGTRAPHIYMEPYIIEEFLFTIDSITGFSQPKPKVMYFDNTNFALIEEFESSDGTFIETSVSDTTIALFPQDQANFNRFGNSSGAGYLHGNNTVFEITSYEEDSPGFQFPVGVPVIFEMEYNVNNTIIVGAFIKNGSVITQHAILVLNPTNNEWRKAYVNLTPTVVKNPNADAFNVFIRADKDSGVDTARILLDNFKLIHRN